MDRYLVVFLATILYAQSYSQDVEHLMTKKYIDCRDIIYNSALLIPEHFAKNNSDTVAALVNYWEKHCGISEPLLRLKILLAINADTLNESLYRKTHIINQLLYYRERVKRQDNGYDDYEFQYTPPPSINSSLDIFTKDLALKLLQREVNSELEIFFLDFYSNNFDKIFLRLQDTSLKSFKLRQAYYKEINSEINKHERHFSIYSGVWIPNGNLSVVGNHPIIGFQGGMKNKKGIMMDIAFEVKFNNSPNGYFVEKNDSLYSTTHFFGGFFGAELGYELINYKSHELDLVGGCGWDGFDALEIGEPNDPDRVTKTINALNLNLGLGYRKYFKNKTYIGIEARYNFVDYQNKNGTDLSGNTLTLRLKYGISRNLYRDKKLMQLDYEKIVANRKYYDWLGNRKVYRWY
jgi:hypothetical protein